MAAPWRAAPSALAPLLWSQCSKIGATPMTCPFLRSAADHGKRRARTGPVGGSWTSWGLRSAAHAAQHPPAESARCGSLGSVPRKRKPAGAGGTARGGL